MEGGKNKEVEDKVTIGYFFTILGSFWKLGKKLELKWQYVTMNLQRFPNLAGKFEREAKAILAGLLLAAKEQGWG